MRFPGSAANCVPFTPFLRKALLLRTHPQMTSAEAMVFVRVSFFP